MCGRDCTIHCEGRSHLFDLRIIAASSKLIWSLNVIRNDD